MKPTPERLEQAKMWTLKGVEIVGKAREELGKQGGWWGWGGGKKKDGEDDEGMGGEGEEWECEKVWAVCAFNLGAILEVTVLSPSPCCFMLISVDCLDAKRFECSRTAFPDGLNNESEDRDGRRCEGGGGCVGENLVGQRGWGAEEG